MGRQGRKLSDELASTVEFGCGSIQREPPNSATEMTKLKQERQAGRDQVQLQARRQLSEYWLCFLPRPAPSSEQRYLRRTMSTAHRVLSEHPLNSEPPSAALVAGGFHTKDALVYHRNHGEVLNIDPTTYSLALSSPEGLFDLPRRDLTIDDVRAFPLSHVEGLLMCAGNRRVEMNEESKVEGLCWDRAALANARW